MYGCTCMCVYKIAVIAVQYPRPIEASSRIRPLGDTHSGLSPLRWDLSSALMVGSLGGLGAYFEFNEAVVSGIALGDRLTREENSAVDGYSGLSPLRCDLSRASMIGCFGSPGAYFDFGEEAVAVIA